MKTMKAVCIYGYGGPEVLVYEEAPRPFPGAGEVLIRIHASGINPLDWKIREGQFKDTLPHVFPLILGWDVSGVVERTGSGVTRLSVGDQIFSHPDTARDGAEAEYMVIRETEVALKPKSLDHVHAAALPLAGLAAWQSLFDAAGLTAGQRVLIHGASGGVGNMAVQLAKNIGAYVIGTASARNHDFLRKLGADQVVDYTTVRFEDAVEPVEVVFDTLGGEVQERSWKVLKPGGILVSIASPPSAAAATAHGVRSAFVFTRPNAGQLADLARLADAGKLKAVVETVLPLSDTTRAQELSQQGHVRGKIVLRIV